jgi:hypothetical protein
MGVLRALVLLTFISWRVGKLTAAMVAGVSSLQSFEVSTTIKPLVILCFFLVSSVALRAAWRRSHPN